MAGRALVLGGGGVTGVAWELGIIAGLVVEGIDLTAADVVVGTSAGSVVGAIITSGEPVASAYDRQLEPPPSSDRSARIGPALLLRYVAVAATARDPQRARAKIGALSLRARTIPEQDRRRAIASRIGDADWPTRQRLLVTAVLAETGEFVVFDRDSGVSLVDAVSASCAVPGVWPPATVNGRRYIDGGTRSPANVDVAADCDRVIVLAPITAALHRDGRPARQLAALSKAHGVVIAPDRDAARAIGSNVLDAARRVGSARAGRAQAASVAAAVRSVWSAS
jgi:NTE family protein